MVRQYSGTEKPTGLASVEYVKDSKELKLLFFKNFNLSVVH